MRKLLVVLCAGLFVVGGAQAYAGNVHGGKKQCQAACQAQFKACEGAARNRGDLSKCHIQSNYCHKKCSG
jgi:hypothetical protein